MSVRGRVLVVFGTRPEATKLAPVVRALRATPDLVTRVCITAQHREMLDQVLTFFDLTPDYDLDLMQPGQSLAAFAGRALQRLGEIVEAFQPAMVIVQGDTASTLCGAMAGFYARAAVAHVEAGLRTHDKWAPFPEEINRQLVSRVADLHFPPTEHARDVLLAEGVPAGAIHVTGNTAVDAVLLASSLLDDNPTLYDSALAAAHLDERPLVLVTAHRRESFGPPIERMFRAIANVALMHPSHQVVYPVHLNPSVQEPALRLLGGIPNLRLTAPLPYAPFVALMRRAAVILTDSGGIQEEAPALGVPVILMREVTERPEAVTAGTIELVGTDPEAILAATARVLRGEHLPAAELRARNPYGDGHAAERIRDRVLQFLA